MEKRQVEFRRQIERRQIEKKKEKRFNFRLHVKMFFRGLTQGASRTVSFYLFCVWRRGGKQEDIPGAWGARYKLNNPLSLTLSSKTKTKSNYVWWVNADWEKGYRDYRSGIEPCTQDVKVDKLLVNDLSGATCTQWPENTENGPQQQDKTLTKKKKNYDT